MENITLTKTDRIILNSYRTMLEGLADYHGEGYEFVLHSLEDFNRSVIKIVNGNLTGRKEGSPITNLALSMLANIEESPDKKYISYFNNSKKDRPLKSSTIAIYGENQRVIGLLCINLYLNTSLSAILEKFVQTPHKTPTEQLDEDFLDNTDDLIVHAFLDAKNHVINTSSPNKNKEIIFILYNKGIFNIKDSTIKVAKLLNISKNTVYMHIRNIKVLLDK